MLFKHSFAAQNHLFSKTFFCTKFSKIHYQTSQTSRLSRLIFSAHKMSWAGNFNSASWAELSFYRNWIWRAELSWAFSGIEFGELSWAEPKSSARLSASFEPSYSSFHLYSCFDPKESFRLLNLSKICTMLLMAKCVNWMNNSWKF